MTGAISGMVRRKFDCSGFKPECGRRIGGNMSIDLLWGVLLLMTVKVKAGWKCGIKGFLFILEMYEMRACLLMEMIQ